MEHSSFDRLARLLGGATTRRAGVQAALGCVLGLVAPGLADARQAPGGTGRRQRRPRSEGPCGDGSRRDNVCSRDSQCCTGHCDKAASRRNKDGEGRCRCVKRGEACKEDRNCCGGRACAGGVCSGGSNPTPTPPPPPPPPPDPCATPTVCDSGCPHTTIQAAIDAAAGGDTITILGGNHTEELSINRNLTLVGCPTATVVDTGANDRTITISNGATVELRNIVVNGTGTVSVKGGGISCNGHLTLSGTSSVTNGSDHTGNWGKGGCVFMQGTSSLTMTDSSSIHDCWADVGACVSSDSDPDSTALTMTGSAKISNCTATTIGGAMWILRGPVSMSGTSEISGCASTAGSGGGVYLASATMTMSGSSVVKSNTSGGYGGGVYLYDEVSGIDSSLTMTESATITGNSANPTYSGGGVYASNNNHTLTAPAGSINNNTPTNCGGGAISCT